MDDLVWKMVSDLKPPHHRWSRRIRLFSWRAGCKIRRWQVWGSVHIKTICDLRSDLVFDLSTYIIWIHPIDMQMWLYNHKTSLTLHERGAYDSSAWCDIIMSYYVNSVSYYYVHVHVQKLICLSLYTATPFGHFGDLRRADGGPRGAVQGQEWQIPAWHPLSRSGPDLRGPENGQSSTRSLKAIHRKRSEYMGNLMIRH